SLLQAEQLADVQHEPAARGARTQHLRGPVVIAEAVDDYHAGARQRAGIGGGRLIAVRICVRVDDDAANVRPAAGELRRDAGPEVLGGYYLQMPVARCC